MHDPAAGGGTLETLQVDLAGRQLRLVLERRGPAAAPLWLLLPALSTVSSRGEWKAFANVMGDRRQLVSFDWPGFGDSDRPAIAYDAALLRSALQAVLSYLRTTTRQLPIVVAAGHSASVALGLATEWSGLWQELVLVAPTWRGPLPTMTGLPQQQFNWLRSLVAAPCIGPALYRLNTSRMLLRLMLRKRAPLVQHVLLQLGLRLSQHRRPPVPSLHRLFWHRILFP